MPYRVLLPKSVFKKSRNERELHLNVSNYMEKYSYYTVLKIEKGFAICGRVNEIRRGN